MRRFMASESMPNIPCYIREMDDQTAKLYSLIENLERANLTPMEEARAFVTYLDWEIHTPDLEPPKRDVELEKRVAKFATQIPISKATIVNRLKLLYLPPNVQTMLENESLYLGEAETIVPLKKLVQIRKKALSDGLPQDKIAVKRRKGS